MDPLLRKMLAVLRRISVHRTNLRRFGLRLLLAGSSALALAACGGGGGSSSANGSSNNSPPVVTAIADQTIDEDTSTGPLAFTVDDAETLPGSLVVTASSTNQGLVANTSLVLGGADADRTIDISPLPDQNGSATITVSVSDGKATTITTFVVNVTPQDDAPTAVADGFSVTRDTSANPLDVLANDTDPDLPGDTLTITGFGATSAGGTVANSGASLQYTPATGFIGTETFSYTIQDSTGTPSTATVTMSVFPPGGGNIPPTITALANQSLDEDTPSNPLAFTVGDVETPAGSLVVTASSSNQALIPNANLVLGGADANRTVTVTPAPNANGGPATITVNVSDGLASTNTSFTVTVIPQNDAPTVSPVADQIIDEDTSSGPLAFSVGDIETSPGSLLVTASSGNQTLIPDANLVLGGADANRTITVTPVPNATSGPVTITVNVSDGTATTPMTFTVTVTPRNDAPTLTAIADQTIDEDTTSGPLGFSVDDIETPAGSLVVTASSSNQALVPDANLVLGGAASSRTIEVIPASNQNGTTTVTVFVSDGSDTTSKNFSVTVTPRNDPPTAVADGFTVNPGTVDAPLDVLDNDVDPDLPADTLTITAVGTPSAGGTVTNTGSQLLYTPASGFTGTETFSYTIKDNAMLSSTATVTVVVPNAGMVHYWRLDEANTPYADAVGSAPANCLTCPSGSAGLIGSAQNFDGLDDALSVGISPPSTGAQLRVSASSSGRKIVPAALETDAVIGRTDSQTQLKWWVGCSVSGEVMFELFDQSGSGQSLTGTSSIVDGDWHHIVAVRDAGSNQNRLYVDGTLEASASKTYANGFTSQTAALNIGWLDDSAVDYHFSGIVDEVAIRNGVLSAADISQHYADGSVGLRRGYLGCTGPVRIMPLGDSITRRQGYRPPLWFDLTGSSYDVDFVGGVADSCPDNPSQCLHDPDHEGHSGDTPADIATSLNGYLTANPPDVILLHIGTNDLNTLDVEDILNITDSFDPKVTVVLARIINRMTFDQPTTDFNVAIAAMAQQRIDNGDKIIIVDMESALTYPDDMSDELHPNQVGFDKMAVVWRGSLATFLPVCP